MTADSSRSPPLFSHFLTLSPSLSLPVLYVSSSFHSSLILIVFFFSPFLHLLSLALSSILEPIFPRRVWSFNLVATRGNGKVQFDWRVMMMMMVVVKMMIRTLEKPFAMSPGQWSRVGPTFQSLLQLLLSTEITHTHMETHTHKKKTQHKHVWLCNYRHFFCTHNYIHTGTCLGFIDAFGYNGLASWYWAGQYDSKNWSRKNYPILTYIIFYHSLVWAN